LLPEPNPALQVIDIDAGQLPVIQHLLTCDPDITDLLTGAAVNDL
jgi:hypothetical protein